MRSAPGFTLVVLLFAALLPGAGCGARKDTAPARPVGVTVDINAPRGLPPMQVPADNPPTAAAIALGRRLFHETKLSSDNTLSCASCHIPEKYFTDGQATAVGVNGQRGTRNTPTALNAAWNATQFWDGRAAGLEEQAGGPIANPIEMNLPHAVCVERLNADAAYRDEFALVFGPGPVTMDKVTKAIASFERTLVSGASPFDRFQFGGEKMALSEAAVRGLAVFTDKKRGNCATCHVIGEKFALFTDHKFHNLGAGMNASGELTDPGRYEQTKDEADRGAFRTPSLRNVACTAPYMHNGSLKTLKDVVDFYVGGGNSNPQLDAEIRPLVLSARDREDLIAFLEALTGELPANAGRPGK
ncbi:MAG: cytochrome-c peroxidase [Blastocatellia bacterium]